LGERAGIEVNGTMQVPSGPDFRRSFPGSISWVVAHPQLSAYLAGPLLLALIMVVVALLWLTGLIR
jgi:hypothetical protein